MSAWSQGFVRTAVNPFVHLGTLAGLMQPPTPTPVAIAPASVGVVAPEAIAPAPDAPVPRLEDDPNYQARVAAILRRRDTGKSDLELQRGQTRKSYGVDDTSDPYSKAKLLQESFQRNKAATGTTLAARGQLYSGALQNAQDTNAHNFAQGQDAMQKAYQTILANIDRQKGQLDIAADEDIANAGSDALSRILATRPDADIAEASGDLGPAAGTEYDAPSGTSNVLVPKKGYQFVAKSGARKGQSYNVLKSGSKTYHVYANGKKIRVS